MQTRGTVIFCRFIVTLPIPPILDAVIPTKPCAATILRFFGLTAWDWFECIGGLYRGVGPR